MPERAKRRINQLRVEFISLVAVPANGESIVLKGDGVPVVFDLAKADDELQRVYGIVYAPDRVDTDGDYIDDPAVIRKAADDFMRHDRNQSVDTNHSFDSEDGVYVAESWIVKEGDPMFDQPGAWAVGIQVHNSDVWRQVKTGELTGLSLAGYGTGTDVEQQPDTRFIDKSQEEDGLFTRICTHIRDEFFKKTDTDMTDKDKAEVAQMIKDAVANAPSQDEPQQPQQLNKKDVEAIVAEAIEKANKTDVNDGDDKGDATADADQSLQKSDVQTMIDAAVADAIKKGADVSDPAAQTGVGVA